MTARDITEVAALARPVYTNVQAMQISLLFLRDAHGIGWDESAEIEIEDGSKRHGVVLEVDGDLAVVQVMEGTPGLRPSGIGVSFAGEPLHIPVGTGWLGRTCNGRGEPVDGGPPILGDIKAPVAGWPLNPVHRAPPSEPVLTGVSAIDALTTLVRGQKLPVFSVPGLPHLQLALQIAAQASASAAESRKPAREEPDAAAGSGTGESFRVVFAGMGLTHADAAFARDALEARSRAGELVTLLNTANDPIIERLLTPRIALTVAEHLAFVEGHHVLVVMSDMTSYCDAVREVAAARKEIPARRAYPGYLYSDLASLYERCGRVRGRPGSVTIVPVLTMPGGDLTHPVPDLTGYITEGQVVLSPESHGRGLYPPVDVLSSLSRLMRKGAGPGRTRDDHLDVASQVIAALARAQQAAELADLIGEQALSETDRSYLEYRKAVERHLMRQSPTETRTLDETLALAWKALAVLPRRELTMLPAKAIHAYLNGQS